MRLSKLLLLCMWIGLTGCGDPIGTACRFEGSGFSASDNCRYRCMAVRNIRCPDGTDIRPQLCSGKPDCTPGSCATGEVCYHVADPFNTESYCLPENVCGSFTPAELDAWSERSMLRAAEMRADYEARKLRRQRMKTVPAPDAVQHGTRD